MKPDENRALDRIRRTLSEEFHLFRWGKHRLGVGRTTGVLFRTSERRHAKLQAFLASKGPADRIEFDAELAATLRAILARLAVKHIEREELDAPTSALLLVAEDCNLSCTYCYGNHGAQPSTKRMGPALASRAAEALAQVGVRSIGFFGGEPLLNMEGIEAFVKRAAELGHRFQYALTTNGTLLTPTRAERLRRWGVAVSVSIDGPRDTHDQTRRYRDGGSTYDDVLRGINSAREAGLLDVLEVTYSRRHGLPVDQMLTAISPLWPRVTCTAVDGSYGSAHEQDVVRGDDLIRWYGGMLDARTSILGVGGIDELVDELTGNVWLRRPYICSGIMRRVVVAHEGTVFPCPELMQPEFRITNINDANFASAFVMRREIVLGQLLKERVGRTWFRDLLDICAVRLRPEGDHWVIDDKDSVGTALEYALGRIVADHPGPAMWDLPES